MHLFVLFMRMSELKERWCEPGFLAVLPKTAIANVKPTALLRHAAKDGRNLDRR